jgi:NAD(P)-dependent dehydrogenase (short-subunit alcohol dehydrogenase family)
LVCAKRRAGWEVCADPACEEIAQAAEPSRGGGRPVGFQYRHKTKGSEMGLEDKLIVILGGTSGIGLEIGRLAVAEGAHVLLASSSQARVKAAQVTVPGAEGRTIDVLSENSIEAFFAELGSFDHLVDTAGDPLLYEPLATLSLARAQAFLGVRFWGAFLAVKYAAPNIRADGSVVLSSGMASRRPGKGSIAIAAACGAAESLARALAVELAPLRVNIVCPGLVDTELWDNLPEAARRALYQRTAQTLIGRPGEAPELAEAYLYLMKNGFSTGEVVVADGGVSVG